MDRHSGDVGVGLNSRAVFHREAGDGVVVRAVEDGANFGVEADVYAT